MNSENISVLPLAEIVALRQQVLDRLKTIEDPDVHQDLVTLGWIKDLRVSPEGGVQIRVQVSAESEKYKDQFRKEIETHCRSFNGVSNLAVEVEVKPSAAQGPGAHAAPPKTLKIAGIDKIITISSGKGGVGKSTVSVNLAVSLARAGYKVGIMDADIYGPNIPLMLGATDHPEVVHGEKGEHFIPPVAHGIKVMSMGFLVPPDQPLIWRGPMLHNILNQFCHAVNWGELDYLLIDMPPGTGDVQLSLAQLLPISGAILVTTPQEVSMLDVRKAFTMWDKVSIPILGVVENMSYFECDGCSKQHSIFGKGGGRVLADLFKTDLLAELPLIQAVRVGGDIGKPLAVQDPGAKFSQLMKWVAETVVQKMVLLGGKEKNPATALHIGRFQ